MQTQAQPVHKQLSATRLAARDASAGHRHSARSSPIAVPLLVPSPQARSARSSRTRLAAQPSDPQPLPSANNQLDCGDQHSHALEFPVASGGRCNRWYASNEVPASSGDQMRSAMLTEAPESVNPRISLSYPAAPELNGTSGAEATALTTLQCLRKAVAAAPVRSASATQEVPVALQTESWPRALPLRRVHHTLSHAAYAHNRYNDKQQHAHAPAQNAPGSRAQKRSATRKLRAAHRYRVPTAAATACADNDVACARTLRWADLDDADSNPTGHANAEAQPAAGSCAPHLSNELQALTSSARRTGGTCLDDDSGDSATGGKRWADQDSDNAPQHIATPSASAPLSPHAQHAATHGAASRWQAAQGPPHWQPHHMSSDRHSRPASMQHVPPAFAPFLALATAAGPWPGAAGAAAARPPPRPQLAPAAYSTAAAARPVRRTAPPPGYEAIYKSYTMQPSQPHPTAPAPQWNAAQLRSALYLPAAQGAVGVAGHYRASREDAAGQLASTRAGGLPRTEQARSVGPQQTDGNSGSTNAVPPLAEQGELRARAQGAKPRRGLRAKSGWGNTGQEHGQARVGAAAAAGGEGAFDQLWRNSTALAPVAGHLIRSRRRGRGRKRP